MKTKIILIALLSMLLVSPAFAWGGSDCNGNGNCSNYDYSDETDVDVDVIDSLNDNQVGKVNQKNGAFQNGGYGNQQGLLNNQNYGQQGLVNQNGTTQNGLQVGKNNVAINQGGGADYDEEPYGPYGYDGPPKYRPSNGENSGNTAIVGINNQKQGQKQKQQQGQLQGQMQGQAAININKDLVDIEVDTTPIGDGLKAQAEADLAIAVEEGKAQAAAQSQAEAFAAEENEKDRKAAKEAAHAGRDFAEAGQLITGGQADYRGPFDDAGPTVLSVFDIMEYQNVFLWKHLKPGKLGFKFGEGVRVKFRTSGLKADRSSSVTYMAEKPNGARFVGFMYAWATGDEADTMLVMQKAAREAMEAGATVAVVISEGHTTHTETFGWGIGLSGVTSTMNGSGKTGSTGHMGTGINKAKAGPEHKPYVQLALFVTE